MKELYQKLDTYSFTTKRMPFQSENSYIKEQIENDEKAREFLQERRDELIEKQKIKEIKQKIKEFVESQKKS